MGKLKSATEKGLVLPRPTKHTVITPFTPAMPDVNLLPPRVFEAAQAQKVRRKLGLIGGAMVLVVAGLYVGQTAQIMFANNALDTETAKGVVLDKQARDLAPVKAFYLGVDAQKTMVQTTMAKELVFSKLASTLLETSGTDAQILTVTVTTAASGAAGTEAAAAGAACTSPDPFTKAAIVTCAQFTGTSAGREGVAKFLANLTKSDKFAIPYVPVTDSADGKGVTFNGSVGITDKFYSNRYADDGYLLKGSGATK
jgi:hypothetical protein